MQENAFYKKDRLTKEMIFKINQYTNQERVIPHMINVALTKDFPDTLLIQKVQCPTLIIWGREDVVIPAEHAERFHRDISNSKVIIFDKSGHCPMMEDPKETAEACINFFENGI